MSAMMLGRVLVVSAFQPGFLLRFADQVLWVAQCNPLFTSKTLRAFSDEHHVRAFLQDGSGYTNGILHPLERRSRAGMKSSAVHHDGVAFHTSVQIQVRPIASVEDRVIFQYHD